MNQLNEIIDLSREGRHHYYTTHIPKRSNKRKTRLIFVFQPLNAEAKIEYENIQRKLATYCIADKNAVGYRKGVGTKMVAQKHQKHNYFYKFDFSNFFPSFGANIVYETFKDKFTAKEISKMLWVLRSNGKPVVQQGNPLSPAVTNIVMKNFDREFLKALKEKYPQSIEYSRYADDILVSTYKPLPFKKVEAILLKTLKDLKLNFLKLNKEKSRALRKGGKVIFLGVSINPQETLGNGHKSRKFIINQIKLWQKKAAARRTIYISLHYVHFIYHQAAYLNSISNSKKIDLSIFNKMRRENDNTVLPILRAGYFKNEGWKENIWFEQA